jgi:hypothetical protein
MDRIGELGDWLDRIGSPAWQWHAKRLSANDTGSTGSNQAGFHIPRALALAVAPELASDSLNPRRALIFDLISHGQRTRPSLIYYNNRLRAGGTRDEFRVTGFGGRASALQDPDSTGSILVTAWSGSSTAVEAWLSGSAEEEDAIESAIGPVEPATHLLGLVGPGGARQLELIARDSCDPALADLPAAWAREFPTGRELTTEAIQRSAAGGEPDRRLVERYRCEFGLFKVVEVAHVMPLVESGFTSVDNFLTVAQAVANRRKSRAGRSLELHLARIFDEERVTYDSGRPTEGNRRPDFVFPSIAEYHAGRPTRMLGVKTSVKDRWRQILDEAALIPEKHLFTLAEGVSRQQYDQMAGSGVRLVVPKANLSKFPEAVRSELITLAEFVHLVR